MPQDSSALVRSPRCDMSCTKRSRRAPECTCGQVLHAPTHVALHHLQLSVLPLQNLRCFQIFSDDYLPPEGETSLCLCSTRYYCTRSRLPYRTCNPPPLVNILVTARSEECIDRWTAGRVVLVCRIFSECVYSDHITIGFLAVLKHSDAFSIDRNPRPVLH
jgi:hypothetical protein